MKKELSPVREITRYGLRGVMSGRKILFLECVCEFCKNPFHQTREFCKPRKFCSKSCHGKWTCSRPEADTQLWEKSRKPIVAKVCDFCGKSFQRQSRGKATVKLRFCGRKCSTSWASGLPESRERARASVHKMHQAVLGMKRPDIVERMTRNNPMKKPEALEKMKKSLSGRTFLSRGGNGTVTVPQTALHQQLGWPMEFPIPTIQARGHFPSLPSCYKVDLANPEAKIAVEVDGRSHRSKKWKFLDRRKTEILNFLGWSVLRFSNEEVMADAAGIAEKIRSFMTSR